MRNSVFKAMNSLLKTINELLQALKARAEAKDKAAEEECTVRDLQVPPSPDLSIAGMFC